MSDGDLHLLLELETETGDCIVVAQHARFETLPPVQTDGHPGFRYLGSSFTVVEDPDVPCESIPHQLGVFRVGERTATLRRRLLSNSKEEAQ
jgi:hypothetical protein